MPKKIMRVDKDGSPPVVSIDVKFPQLGQYDVTLWNADGKKPRTVGRGNTTDKIKDTFDLVAKRTDLASLEGHQMVWVIWIQRLSKDAKSSFEYRIRVVQDGTEIARDEGKGKMDTSFKPFHGTYVIRL